MKRERKTLSLPADVITLIPAGSNLSAWVAGAIQLRSALDEATGPAERTGYLCSLVDAQRWRVECAARELITQGVSPDLVHQLAIGLNTGAIHEVESPRPVLDCVRVLLEESLMGGRSVAESLAQVMPSSEVERG